MTKIALIIEYSGMAYCGWQRQSHSPSVQETLERALSRIADHPVRVFCAGRTDTGVHATAQVVHFELQNPRPLNAWLRGANNILADDICIRWATEVDADFHARHSAIARRYRYVIQNTPYPPAILKGRASWQRQFLDHDRMHRAAQALVGENNFSSFRAASCQASTPMRNLQVISVKRWQDFVVLDIQANAFLHHMVRNIVGCLQQVGLGHKPVEYVAKILAERDRTKAPATAKPDGLYLVRVLYPEPYALPNSALGPLLLPDVW